MKEIKTVDAIGHVLCHDITRIIRGVEKGPVFKKGHVISEEDIPVLLDVGKEYVYVWEKNEDMLHEDEAARIMYEIAAGDYIHPTEPSEGKIGLIADRDGILKIDRERLNAINGMKDLMIASRHGDFPVKAGDHIAGTRVIPLVIKKEKMEKAREAVRGAKIFNILPFFKMKAGIVTTGSEILNGRIEDTFTPVLLEKLAEYDVDIIGQELTGDDVDKEEAAIRRFVDEGATMVLCTGGMSVDPDDRTPLAIRRAAPLVATYGAPVLPGAMFMLAYRMNERGWEIPVMGLPGCVMYAKRTIFDLVLPRIVAGEHLTREDFTRLGEGGLCLNCDVCTFPNCGFGKG